MERGGLSSPEIPPRTHQTPKPARRRRSSAAKSATGSSPSSRSAKPHPPSPEVISSLISSLAAISTPDQHHLDHLPRFGSSKSESPPFGTSHPEPPTSTDPVRPTNERDPSRSPPSQQGFGVDYGAYKKPEEDDRESYLVANTAFPPVVRMSKQRTTSSRSRSRTPTLKLSQQSLRSKEETGSTGQVTTEPRLQPSSASVASLKSGGFSAILGRKRSKEAVSTVQNERDTLRPLASALRHSSSRSSLMTDRIDEATPERQPSVACQTSSNDDPSSSIPAAVSKPRTSSHPSSFRSGRLIPSRQSSLQQSTANSSGTTSSKSLSRSRKSKDLRIAQDDKEEEDSTVRRIRELQEQKEKRERVQRREDRKRKKKGSRNSVPAIATLPRTRSNQSLRHSVPEVWSGTSDQQPVNEDDGAPAPAVPTHVSTRMSAGALPSKASRASQARTEVVTHEDRPAVESRPVTPCMHQRAQSDPQFRPGRGSLGVDRPRSADSIDDAVEAYLASPRLTQRIRHPESGRVIAFSEVGDPSGFPVVCCVGMGMTRYVMAFYDELALTLRLRLITIDRPGVGESESCSDGTGVPLNWPDDVSIVCNALSISRFSLIAHSAGAIYALATALRLPQQVRGRLHLLAPWIPPSQMAPIGSQEGEGPSNSVPYSQKLLRVLPASFLRAANSSFMSSTTSSGMLKSPRRSKRKSAVVGNGVVDLRPSSSSGLFNNRSSTQASVVSPDVSSTDLTNTGFQPHSPYVKRHAALRESAGQLDDNVIRARQFAYDANLTQRIWELAQRHANPAIDLLICLERRQTIGFRYVDITRACIFHHGSRDSRVPPENVKWLAKKMRRCEVRMLEGEGHGLMASAKIMAEILTEVAREWEDWSRVTREGRGRKVLPGQVDD